MVIGNIGGAGVLQSSGGNPGMIFLLVYLAIIVLGIAGMWKTFTKAGQPGWAAIIPFYNVYILLNIAERPIWWLIVIIFVPIVNLILIVLVMIDVAKAFGKGAGYGLGLAFLGFIFFPLLGFGDAQYQTAAN